MLTYEFVLYLLEAGLVLSRFLLVLLLHLRDLTLILGHESLLGGVSLVSELLDDCFNFPVSLTHHLFSYLALGLNVLVLGLLQELTLQLILLNH